jgi:predicted acetyltransferase
MLLPEGTNLKVIECELPNDILDEVSFRLFESQPDFETISYLFPTDTDKPGEIRPHGMARINDATSVLKHYSILNPEKNLSFSLIDEYLPVNNGVYNIGNGIVKKSGNAEMHITIAELTSFVLGVTDLTGVCKNADVLPYMSLMMD